MSLIIVWHEINSMWGKTAPASQVALQSMSVVCPPALFLTIYGHWGYKRPIRDSTLVKIKLTL